MPQKVGHDARPGAYVGKPTTRPRWSSGVGGAVLATPVRDSGEGRGDAPANVVYGTTAWDADGEPIGETRHLRGLFELDPLTLTPYLDDTHTVRRVSEDPMLEEVAASLAVRRTVVGHTMAPATASLDEGEPSGHQRCSDGCGSRSTAS